MTAVKAEGHTFVENVIVVTIVSTYDTLTQLSFYCCSYKCSPLTVILDGHVPAKE